MKVHLLKMTDPIQGIYWFQV